MTVQIFTVQIFTSMILLAGVHFAAMLSPGPTMLIVLRRAAQPHITSMLPLVLGIVSASATSTLLTLLGVAALIAASDIIGVILSGAGAAYLTYLGTMSILAGVRRFNSRQSPHGPPSAHPNPAPGGITGRDYRSVTRIGLFRQGYLVNLLNPKVAVFYISIFSQVASPNLPDAVLGIFGGQLILQSFAFWTVFAGLARLGMISKAINQSNGWVDIAFGAALVAFALYLLWHGL